MDSALSWGQECGWWHRLLLDSASQLLLATKKKDGTWVIERQLFWLCWACKASEVSSVAWRAPVSC